MHSLLQLRYALLQIFSKFGKVTKLDFLFHKTGPCKGKPRGYAFIEFGDQNVSYADFIPTRLSLTPGFSFLLESCLVISPSRPGAA
jgi:RNA recognition motif. (a.k.a. RRM, RBD, or RNP domain)